MGKLIRIDNRLPRVVSTMGVEESRREWREQEDNLIEISEEQMRVAEALWCEGGEGPPDWRDAGVTGDDLVQGVKSLHEFTDRVLEENERLRAELATARGLP